MAAAAAWSCVIDGCRSANSWKISLISLSSDWISCCRPMCTPESGDSASNFSSSSVDRLFTDDSISPRTTATLDDELSHWIDSRRCRYVSKHVSSTTDTSRSGFGDASTPAFASSLDVDASVAKGAGAIVNLFPSLRTRFPSTRTDDGGATAFFDFTGNGRGSTTLSTALPAPDIDVRRRRDSILDRTPGTRLDYPERIHRGVMGEGTSQGARRVRLDGVVARLDQCPGTRDAAALCIPS
ncbi:hypothetical protein PBRA_002641 [Plasmodiophora brassicae]|uniref:Uncharacterized protein n=1 Tax=Plasmodiophora brassicae TaxID=37360 RepID=A0A0G4J5P1_PLABS|nr:hypothetical protein PBRA_002641 [Plasmodiophora brassicae]